MEFTKEDLNLENGLEKEWLITNGIGGYSSSTIIGANTRKYHGLLVAPLTPPARRFLILSKLDESIEINEKKYDLYTNICKEYISRGYEYQEEFRKEYEDQAKDAVKSRLVIEAVAKEEKIEADDKEVDEKIKEMAENYGKTEDELKSNESLKNYLKENLKTEKTIEFIVKNAKIK